jgi:sterol desaturase/sphingolipid hydroxylase (fatty acid hydroxylase superfamily)
VQAQADPDFEAEADEIRPKSRVVGNYEVHVTGSGRQFQSDFFEKFSKCHGSVPIIFYTPIIGGAIYLAATRGVLSAVEIAGGVVAGVAIWTLVEYWLHRLVFHYERSPRLHYFLHGIHHAYPNDRLRLVMPPGASFSLAVAFFLIMWGLVGFEWALPTYAGLGIGYLWYDTTHWWTHVAKPKTAYGRFLRKHHMLHHFKTPDRRFGVSTPLWDYVFRTHA